MEKSNLMSDFLEPGRLRKLLHRIFAGAEDEPDLHKILLKMTGGTHATGIMLALVVKWDSRMRGRSDGWWYKSDQSWENEVGLSQHDVRVGRDLMKAVGVSSERRIALDGRRTWHYKLDARKFWQAFADACGLLVEQLMHLILRIEVEEHPDQWEKSPVTVGKIPSDSVENSQGQVGISPETVGKSHTVLHPESSVFASEIPSVDKAAADAHARAQEPPATAPDLPVLNSEKSNFPVPHSMDPRPPIVPPPGNPPPVPPRPLPTPVMATRLEDDPLWLAFECAWGDVKPVVPGSCRLAYLEARDRLVLLRALPDEVETLTRHKLKQKREQIDEGKAVTPYRFTYIADDIQEWRKMRALENEPPEPSWKKYTNGKYAAFINNFPDHEDAPTETGHLEPAGNLPAQ